MGFIPIIATMSAAIILFFLTVNISLNSKKEKVINLQKEIIQALASLGLLETQFDEHQLNELQHMKTLFAQSKAKADKNVTEKFVNSVQTPYRSLKLIVLQYNNIVSKKPYSFVAKVMGHQKLYLK